MSALPSFPELMESLGLPADAKLPNKDDSSLAGDSTTSRSPSPSASPRLEEQPQREPSPTIVVSQFESDEQPADESQADGFRRRASSGNIKSARFSPYSNVSINLVTRQHNHASLNLCAFFFTKRRGSVSAIDRQRDQEQRANHRKVR